MQTPAEEKEKEPIVYGITNNKGEWLCGNDRITRYFSNVAYDLKNHIIIYSKVLKAEQTSRDYSGTMVKQYVRKQQ